ncbi:trans-aconitate 2-methyltransferase [Halobacillus sp. Marseille-P3879]|uniref:class I SAM-dependent methyltransferase n=1 Tax=Halobacillus sp. Marseille-P3879 TaxID=2045014 RepID=UPI000C7DD1E1|nr:class I SAM-dependent methyltransferase [Halobacillus sp. Marseille-P3879]
MNEWINAMQARKWMKKNESFLPVWHAYVGSELQLFDYFKKARTVESVSEETGYPLDLLASWVRVGVAVKHMKRRPNQTFRTSKKRCASIVGNNASPGVKALVKEIMELHMPTLLKYPEYMREQSRARFDHERHGEVVAETSALLEHFAIKKIKKMLSDRNVRNIVDLGCGHGGYLRKLADEHPHVQMTGVDLNKNVIMRARKESAAYPNISFEVGDINSWVPEEGSADVILLHNIFHYIHPDSREGLLEHLNTYAARDGLISVITPISETEHGEAFSSAFNSFFVAHSNLFALPNKLQLQEISECCHFEMFDLDPIVKEGSWYTFWLTPSIHVHNLHQRTGTDNEEQTIPGQKQPQLTQTS